MKRLCFISFMLLMVSITSSAQTKNIAQGIQDCRTFMSSKGIELKLDTIKKNPTGLQTLAVVLNKDTEYSFMLTSNCYGLKLTLYKDTVLCGSNLNGKNFMQGFSFVCKKSGLHVLKYDFSGISNPAFKGAMIYFFVGKIYSSEGSTPAPKNITFPALVKE